MATYLSVLLIGHVAGLTDREAGARTVQTALRPMSYAEMLRFRAERGITSAIVDAARQQRMTTSEYLRRVVRRGLEADGVSLPPLDERAA